MSSTAAQAIVLFVILVEVLGGWLCDASWSSFVLLVLFNIFVVSDVFNVFCELCVIISAPLIAAQVTRIRDSVVLAHLSVAASKMHSHIDMLLLVIGTSLYGVVLSSMALSTRIAGPTVVRPSEITEPHDEEVALICDGKVDEEWSEHAFYEGTDNTDEHDQDASTSVSFFDAEESLSESSDNSVCALVVVSPDVSFSSSTLSGDDKSLVLVNVVEESALRLEDWQDIRNYVALPPLDVIEEEEEAGDKGSADPDDDASVNSSVEEDAGDVVEDALRLSHYQDVHRYVPLPPLNAIKEEVEDADEGESPVARSVSRLGVSPASESSFEDDDEEDYGVVVTTSSAPSGRLSPIPEEDESEVENLVSWDSGTTLVTAPAVEGKTGSAPLDEMVTFAFEDDPSYVLDQEGRRRRNNAKKNPPTNIVEVETSQDRSVERAMYILTNKLPLVLRYDGDHDLSSYLNSNPVPRALIESVPSTSTETVITTSPSLASTLIPAPAPSSPSSSMTKVSTRRSDRSFVDPTFVYNDVPTDYRRVSRIPTPKKPTGLKGKWKHYIAGGPSSAGEVVAKKSIKKIVKVIKNTKPVWRP
ncbi:hypothetical protein SISNIDRAFT_487664 [Sistotremastrum niveocremeum HHB9708]|uniref:Uncharacterized protein n=1 Tax=Sistotremastrum niveocremeum HHB9708 TaxID=1314777 RepID=A0A164SCJ1_9AGAM|nr:hypothetical protein SISNIDRAFT_487664 [Sistotremastrum niveocremeum HHB9708]